MSAKNRGSIVIPQEKYYTPEASVDAILAEIDWTKVKTFTEPCRGTGAIYDKIPLPDEQKYWCELDEGRDYLNTKIPKVDLIVTNPPFSLTLEFITNALTESDCVIILQRLNYLGSKTRKPFWSQNPPTHLFVLSERPKFIAKCKNKQCDNNDSYRIIEPAFKCVDCGEEVKPQSDSTEYCWFVFSKGYGEQIIKRPRGVYVI